MSADPDARDGGALTHHPDAVLFPSEPGTVVVFLGKEALLSWFTTVRSNERREVIDRLYHLGQSQAVFTTSSYQLVEVFTKVRYEKSAEETVALLENVSRSPIRILYGSEEWDDVRRVETPKELFERVTETFESRPRIEFSFPEAVLVLALVRENRNRDVPVYLFTFDGTLAALADTFGVPVLPYSTPLRDDTGR